MEKNVLVIPSLNPNENFLDLLDNFKSKIAENNIKLSIVVVNDGSSSKFDNIFEKIKKRKL